MADPTPEVYAAAADAYRGELQIGEWHAAEPASLRAAVDAVWRIAEREIRAKVAAEIRNEAQGLRRLAKDAKDRRDDGDPDAAGHLDRFLAKAVALEQVAGRIAEGGGTDGR